MDATGRPASASMRAHLVRNTRPAPTHSGLEGSRHSSFVAMLTTTGPLARRWTCRVPGTRRPLAQALA